MDDDPLACTAQRLWCRSSQRGALLTVAPPAPTMQANNVASTSALNDEAWATADADSTASGEGSTANNFAIASAQGSGTGELHGSAGVHWRRPRPSGPPPTAARCQCCCACLCWPWPPMSHSRNPCTVPCQPILSLAPLPRSRRQSRQQDGRHPRQRLRRRRWRRRGLQLVHNLHGRNHRC